MILSFLSNLLPVEVRQPILKGTPTQIYHLVGASMPVFIAPIDLKAQDHILVDIRTGSVELIQRGYITIWRAAWKN